jgi:CRP-like cAMP-binding protein
MAAAMSAPEHERALLASALAGAGLELLDRVERYSVTTYSRAGRALYYQGDEGAAAYLVTDGTIRLLRVKGDTQKVLDEAGPGSWLGLAETWLCYPYMLDTLALEASSLRRISRGNLMELCRDPAF